MPKPFLNYSGQLNKLINEKNLIIADKTQAEQCLRHIGYFSLISGYKDIFKNPSTKTYQDDVTFDEIVALYFFDETLREIFLKYLIRIERHLRSSISYYFTELHGESQATYLDPANYNVTAKNMSDVTKLISILSDFANCNTHYAHLIHNRQHYNNVPLWVLVTCLTFGSLSKMYKFLPQTLQVKVSKDFATSSPKELQQYLSVLTLFRNCCAHGERLFSKTIKEAIPDTPLHQKMGIPKKNNAYIQGKHDLFGVVIALRYLLPPDDFRKFKSALNNNIQHFLKRTTHVSEIQLLKMMGFPSNWKNITRYKM